MPTDIDTVLKELSDIKGFVQTRIAEGIKPYKEENDRLALALKEVQAHMQDIQRERLAKMSDSGKIRVMTGPLAGYDLLDLKMLEELMKTRIIRGKTGQKSIAAINEARSAIQAVISPESILGWEARAMSMRATGFAGIAPARQLEAFRGNLTGWVRAMIAAHMKTKALDSTTASGGDELVPTFEAAELWLDVNMDTLVLPLMPQLAMPTNPFDIPRQLGDVNWYPSTENVQATTTDPTTGKSTLTAYGLKAGVPFSDELEEDAVIALIPEIRRSIVRNAAEVIDDVILNGDTTGTNNINADGATITTATAGKAQWLLGFDGLIHLPIVDNTAMAENKNAAVDADVYNKILATMGRYAVPRRRGEVCYVADVNTAIRSLSIAEFETIDVAGARATLSTGELINVYGKPLIQSEQMKLADTDGKVTSAGNATDTGRILCFNTSQWRVGFRREISVETDREPGKGQTTMYVSFRIALTERSGTRSTATHTALAYDITGVA